MRILVMSLLALALPGCSPTPEPHTGSAADDMPATTTVVADYYGTLEPFAADPIYFVLTDRFVNGDAANDHRDQGGDYPTWEVPVPGPDGQFAYAGYLGGDFKGLLDHADYIREMGFGAVWLTPIVDNPDAAFSGGDPLQWKGFFTDGGKSGFHGYWGTNFYKLDEHLPSAGIDFASLTEGLHAQGLKTVLDIVCNHGSPSYRMPFDQPQFGKLYDAEGRLLADHQNLPPEQLDPEHNPLHAFYNTGGNLAQLGDFNENNPALMDYMVGAYLQWIDQGVDALRIDTIRWMPDSFWKVFAAHIREKHPGLFMFGEDFPSDADRDDAEEIAHHTWPDGGSISVLDFPMKSAMVAVFGREQAGYQQMQDVLHLENGPYANPYDLVTFYDNHDMPRLDADDSGFIDAHNWLFTARGIPAVYYGSESGFMRGRAELEGNRNYFGVEGIDAAREHPIRQALIRVAKLRQSLVSLQRGLQVDVELSGDRAAFYRVYQYDGESQIALVLLNKGDSPAGFGITDSLQAGAWRDAESGETRDVSNGGSLDSEVPAHGLRVWVLDAPVSHPALRISLDRASPPAHRRTDG